MIRTPAAFIPGFFIPLFFFFVQSGSLSRAAAGSGFPNYKAFVLPVAILFSVSNEGAGFNMVQDIERGYFDKLMLSPANRSSVLIGTVGANFIGILLRSLIVTLIALAIGMEFATGLAGVFPMVLLASLWGFVFANIGTAVAIKTANAQAVQGSLVFLFPMLFLTTSFAPRVLMEGWLRTAVAYNPITYVLEAMREFSWVDPTAPGFDWWVLGKAVIALAIMAPLTFGFASRALHKRLT